MSGLLSSFEGLHRNLLEAWQGNMDSSQSEAGDQGPFPVATVILGFLSIFNKSQASSPFEALNSAYLLSCQRDVRPPVQMRWGPRAFSSVPTGDSNIPSSCEMKGEPAFKTLQGNPAFFRVRASRCPLHLTQKLRVPLTYGLLRDASSSGAC